MPTHSLATHTRADQSSPLLISAHIASSNMGACASQTLDDDQPHPGPRNCSPHTPRRQTHNGNATSANKHEQSIRSHSDTDKHGGLTVSVIPPDGVGRGANDGLASLRIVPPDALTPPINELLLSSSRRSPGTNRESRAKSMGSLITGTPHGNAMHEALKFESSICSAAPIDVEDKNERVSAAASSAHSAACSLAALPACNRRISRTIQPISVSSIEDSLPSHHEGQAQPSSPPLHSTAIRSLCVTGDDGHVLSCAADDKGICLYDWKRRHVLQRWVGHSKGVESLACDGSVLAATSGVGHPFTLFSASRDASIRQWTMDNAMKEVRSFRGHTLTVTALLYRSHDVSGGMLLSAGRDYSIRSWDVMSGMQVSMRSIVKNVATCMRWIAPYNNVNQISALSASVEASRNHEPSSSFSASPSPAMASVPDVAAGFDAHCFLQCCEDPANSVRIWDVRSMEVVATFPTTPALRSTITANPYSSALSSSSSSSSSVAPSSQQYGKYALDVCSDPLNANYFIVSTTAALPINESGDVCEQDEYLTVDDRESKHPLANNASGGEVQLWDRRCASTSPSSSRHSPVLTLHAHADAVTSALYMPAQASVSRSGVSSYIVTSSKDGTLKVWDVSAAPSSLAAEDDSLCSDAISSWSSSAFSSTRCTQVLHYATDKRFIGAGFTCMALHVRSDSYQDDSTLQVMSTATGYGGQTAVASPYYSFAPSSPTVATPPETGVGGAGGAIAGLHGARSSSSSTSFTSAPMTRGVSDVLYVGADNGSVSAWAWNMSKHPGKLQLIAQTKPATSA